MTLQSDCMTCFSGISGFAWFQACYTSNLKFCCHATLKHCTAKHSAAKHGAAFFELWCSMPKLFTESNIGVTRALSQASYFAILPSKALLLGVLNCMVELH